MHEGEGRWQEEDRVTTIGHVAPRVINERSEARQWLVTGNVLYKGQECGEFLLHAVVMLIRETKPQSCRNGELFPSLNVE